MKGSMVLAAVGVFSLTWVMGHGILLPPSSAITLFADEDLSSSLAGVAHKVSRNDQGQITKVDLRGEQITRAILEQLASFTHLRELNLADTELVSGDIRTLGEIKTLERLDLRGCKLHGADLQLLEPLQNLKVLRMNGKNGKTHLRDADMASIARHQKLQALFIDFVAIGDSGIRTLSAHPSLRELGLAGTTITDESLGVVASLPRIKKLRISNTNISGAGLETLGQHAELRDLDMSGCQNLEEGHLLYLTPSVRLQRINLYDTKISDEGVKHLESIGTLSWLNLDKTQISNAALHSIAKLDGLVFLHLGSTNISDEALGVLRGLKHLRELIVTNTQVTRSGVAALQDHCPDLKITWGPKSP